MSSTSSILFKYFKSMKTRIIEKKNNFRRYQKKGQKKIVQTELFFSVIRVFILLKYLKKIEDLKEIEEKSYFCIQFYIRRSCVVKIF
jgi:hypothetical protein